MTHAVMNGHAIAFSAPRAHAIKAVPTIAEQR